LPPLVAAGLAGLNLIWAYVRLPETLHYTKRSITRSYLALGRLKETFGDTRLAFLLTIFFMHVFAFSNMESTFALFGEHRIGMTAFGVGGLLAEVGVIASVVQGLLIGRLTKRFGEITLTIWGIFLMGVGLLLNTQVYSVLGFALVVPFYALGSALTNPTLSALISRTATETHQGGTLGVSQGLGALARVLGPLCGTWLFQILSPEAPYFVGSAVLGIVWIATLIRLRRTMAPVLIVAEETA
jgi:MFS family permease